ncbi:TlpA family protein disulfide reductase [Caviibacterium pharyngocola]|uniref:Thioredoxin n=1 Tax=Caviibacterium pharyngocola TaxID=28159 RepID=A0A2M8RUT2_9PAST|nr:TlpA disulfide reductase family protein [Caviibacterium pharyngocola]PJG82650.1 thioredoxin [Caviibacterium pharyngocola]
MKFNNLIKWLLISAVGFCLISCKEETATVGGQAPEIAVFDLQGQPVNLQDYQGKTTLLNFWSETCGICIAELKELAQLEQENPNKIHILAINIDGANADTQKTVEKRQIHLPVVKDQMKISAERYQLIGTPTSFIIDPQGKILYKFEGLIPQDILTNLFKGN